MNELPVLHHSGYKQWRQCPRKCQFDVRCHDDDRHATLHRLVEHEGRNTVFGTALHALAEAYLRRIAAWDDLPALAEGELDLACAAYARVTWKGATDRATVLAGFSRHLDNLGRLFLACDLRPGSAYPEVALSATYASRDLFALGVDGDLDARNLRLHGTIDAVQPAGGDSVYLFDYKTTARNDVLAPDQLDTYALLCRANGLVPLRGYYLFTADGTAQAVEFDQRREAVLLGNLRRAAVSIAAGDDVAKPSVLCRYCDYRPLCPEGSAQYG